MILWRISRHHDLSGTGGLRAAGRWHHAGQPVVYLAESPASALLEVCVHTASNDVPPDFTLLRIEGPDLKVPTLVLPPDWTTSFDITRDLGTTWLRKAAAPLLAIPSAIVPETPNYLLNPLHPDARKFRITVAHDYPFDTRLKR